MKMKTKNEYQKRFVGVVDGEDVFEITMRITYRDESSRLENVLARSIGDAEWHLPRIYPEILRATLP